MEHCSIIVVKTLRQIFGALVQRSGLEKKKWRKKGEEVLPLQSPHLNAFSGLITSGPNKSFLQMRTWKQITTWKNYTSIKICSILLFLKSSNFRLTDLVNDHKVGQFYKINSGLKLRLIWRTKTGQMDHSRRRLPTVRVSRVLRASHTWLQLLVCKLRWLY